MFVNTVVMLGAALAFSASAAAGGYPDRAVTIVVPYSAGGLTDLYGRLIGKYLGTLWGVPVIVENKGGAGTMIGTQTAARAKPDGYTLLLTSYAYTSNPILRRHLPYSKDALQPVMLVGRTSNMLVVSAKTNLHTLNDVIAKAKKSPGNLRLASSGNGSSPQIAAELWAKAVGVKITHVPYKGTSPAMNDVYAGQVDGIFDGLSSMPAVKSGMLRAIAIASEKRQAAAPNVPTFKELGVNLIFGSWFGFFVPQGTPDAIVKKLNADMRRAVDDPATRAALENTHLVIDTGSPAKFAHFLKYESSRLQDLVNSGADIAVE
ncbi:tripartite tricarboxylate transporter substrate binding protein [Candidimonas humi]|jgi:tripartite-type tricarboxylate transporter receptor subunit TctC|uniref:Tripartite tricarboxylate transporter substrate binding protein n=1 Tax=Candidimonas humi TaxID=683355 RepID=A0ABV8NXF4_9BURK|nr:tripartite tricarboxylate transporter substrate binding protein [Candidimonas humi]MBV6306347.1 tripartite tricarboxylate transporter substrate binding protein [Candidimonas humi]